MDMQELKEMSESQDFIDTIRRQSRQIEDLYKEIHNLKQRLETAHKQIKNKDIIINTMEEERQINPSSLSVEEHLQCILTRLGVPPYDDI